MLNLKKFNGYSIAVILVIVMVFMSLKMCNDLKDKNIAQHSIEKLLKENGELQTYIDDLGRQHASKEVIEIPKNAGEAIKETPKLKTLETKVIFKTITRTDTIEVHLTDTFIVEQDDTTKIKAFHFDDGWVKLGGKVVGETLTMDSLIVANDYTIEIGKERKWLLGKEKKVVYIRNENPHTKTDDVVSFVINDSKKWHQTDAFKIGLGGLAAILLLR